MAIEKVNTKAGAIKWKVDIWSKGKKVKAATFTQRKDADDWERKEQIALEQEQYFPERVKSISFGDLYNEWIVNHCEKYKAPNSVVKDRQMFKQYLSPVFADKLVTAIRPLHIDDFVSLLQRSTGLKNTSINRVLESLRASLNYAIRKHYLLQTPMLGFKMLPVEEQAFDYFSYEEASHFLSHANQKYREENRWVYAFYLTLLMPTDAAGAALPSKM